VVVNTNQIVAKAANDIGKSTAAKLPQDKISFVQRVWDEFKKLQGRR